MARVLCLAACMALLPGAAQAQGVSGSARGNELTNEQGAGADASACAPRITAVQAARAADGARPATGWEPVTLPDVWTHRWPGHDGTVWYRIDWQRGCAGAAGPVALGIDGISVAGEVYINDELLWRDASLTEPLSRSWNVPRWWMLPESALHPGVNTVWVRAVGPAALTPGLGAARLGDARTVAEAQQSRELFAWMVGRSIEDPANRELFRQARVQPRGPTVLALQLAIARGELAPDLDMDLAMHVIQGPLISMRIVDDHDVSDAELERMLDLTLRALGVANS